MRIKKTLLAFVSMIVVGASSVSWMPAHAGIVLTGSFLNQYQDATPVSWYAQICPQFLATPIDCDTGVLLAGYIGEEVEWNGTALSSRVIGLDVTGSVAIQNLLSSFFGGSFDNYFINGIGTSGLAFAANTSGLNNLEAFARGNYLGPTQEFVIPPSQPPDPNRVSEPWSVALVLAGVGAIAFINRRTVYRKMGVPYPLST